MGFWTCTPIVSHALAPVFQHGHPLTPTVVKTSCNLLTSVIRPGSFTLILLLPSASMLPFIPPRSSAYAHALGLVCAIFPAVSPGDTLFVSAYLECAGPRSRVKVAEAVQIVFQEITRARGSGERMELRKENNSVAFSSTSLATRTCNPDVQASRMLRGQDFACGVRIVAQRHFGFGLRIGFSFFRQMHSCSREHSVKGIVNRLRWQYEKRLRRQLLFANVER